MSLLVSSRSFGGLLKRYVFIQCRFCTARRENLPIREPPKKPLSGYQLFMKDILAAIVKEYPGIRLSAERMKIAASRWHASASDTKQKYMRQAESEKQRYKVEHEAFIASLSDEEFASIKEFASQKKQNRQLRKIHSKLKELEKPKGPRTAFNFYCKMKTDDKPIMDKIKEIAESWRRLPEKEKQTFLAQAEEDKRRYEEQMTDWETKMEQSGHNGILQQLHKLKSRHVEYLKSTEKKKAPNKT